MNNAQRLDTIAQLALRMLARGDFKTVLDAESWSAIEWNFLEGGCSLDEMRRLVVLAPPEAYAGAQRMIAACEG